MPIYVIQRDPGRRQFIRDPRSTAGTIPHHLSSHVHFYLGRARALSFRRDCTRLKTELTRLGRGYFSEFFALSPEICRSSGAGARALNFPIVAALTVGQMNLEGRLVHGGGRAVGRRVPAALAPAEPAAAAIASCAHPLMAAQRKKKPTVSETPFCFVIAAAT